MISAECLELQVSRPRGVTAIAFRTESEHEIAEHMEGAFGRTLSGESYVVIPGKFTCPRGKFHGVTVING